MVTLMSRTRAGSGTKIQLFLRKYSATVLDPVRTGFRNTNRSRANGGRSSMVELQIVVLAVAGSSPVGHPICDFPVR